MKIVKILGTGCPNCNQTEKVIESVINQLNLDYKIEKVDDIQEIMKYNIMSTPAIVVDEKVVLKGRVPSLTEAKELLENANVSTCCSDSNASACCSSDSHKDDACCNSDSNKNDDCNSETKSNKVACC